MLKKNGGITLIALVITIIVLLILAGVSLAMLSGDNGVLNRASQASVQNQLGSLNDAVSLYVTEKVAEYYEKAYVEQNTSISGETLNAYLSGITAADLAWNDANKTGIEGLTTDTESTTQAKVVVSATTSGTKSLDSIVLTMKDSKYTYTSTGTVKNGKIKWVITKA